MFHDLYDQISESYRGGVALLRTEKFCSITVNQLIASGRFVQKAKAEVVKINSSGQ